jgi:uncharacterized Zn finger protein
METVKQIVKKKQQKKNALVLCRDGGKFWTTQKQFWQWAKTGVVIKTGDKPLTGIFVREDEEKMVVIASTVLNLSCPNHLREAISQRRYACRR